MNIWFNRWFSTVTHYIEMIRNNPDGRKFKIYGTHPNIDSVYLKYCDVAGTEPDIKGEEYIEFCLNFCKENKIDVFIPRKENVNISNNLDRFNEIGVNVLVCHESDLMNMMDNKEEMYVNLENKKKEGKHLVNVPVYRIVNNVDSFKEAYSELKDLGLRVCIKPIVGEGALGFRLIDNSADSIDYLFSTSSTRKMTFDHMVKILSSVDHFQDVMVLEYLEGPEYSIDCLADKNGNLKVAIPRKKGNGRVRELEYNEQLLEIARLISEEYKIPFVFNIQVMMSNGIPKLLEINPRMSGGLHISCLSGVNIPYYALKLLLGEEIEDLKPDYGIKATYVEQPILLSDKSK